MTALHRKSILIIILVSLITFGNGLSNGFVGDDHLIIVNNTFYETWANFPKLFTLEYITESDEAFNLENFSHTGSVAYRPVVSAAFFLDYWLWRRVPFGYHFDSLLLHVFNAVLVYFIFFRLLRDLSLALWGAILFAVHPFKSEAVCAIGYRADILASLFFLAAFLSYIHRDQFTGTKRKALRFLSHAVLLPSLFAKESAVVFVPVLMAFDILVKKEKWSDVFKHLYGRYLGYVMVTLFYLYIYLYMFRNSTLGTLNLMGGGVLTHALGALNILGQYLAGFILPLSVKALPPLYAPPLNEYTLWLGGWGFALFILLIYLACRHEKPAIFFIVWFLIALLPVSNVIPLVNPMAYRFMYLPSVGFLAVAAVILNRWGMSLDKFFHGIRIGAALRWGIVLLCMITTLSLNMAWKSSLVMASMMVRDFPQSPIGYLHLGIEYFRIGAVDKARVTLQQGFAKGLDDPRGYYYMGLCYFYDWARAKPYYEKSIRLFPRYALSYVGLGRIYVLSGHYAEAIPYLEKAVALAPSYTGYGYLIQSYLHTGRPDDALAVLRRAQGVLREKSRLDSLERFIKEGDRLKGSVDIGI